MRENSVFDNLLTRIYRRGSSYLTLVQKVGPLGYMTIHTIFYPIFDFTLYPSIQEKLSDTVSFGFRYQKSKQLYCAFLEKEEVVDGKVRYEKLWETKAISIEEAFGLLEEKVHIEKGLGR